MARGLDALDARISDAARRKSSAISLPMRIRHAVRVDLTGATYTSTLQVQRAIEPARGDA